MSKKKPDVLVNSNRNAKRRGMTYGEYQAEKYLDATRIEIPEWAKKQKDYKRRRKEFLQLCEENNGKER